MKEKLTKTEAKELTIEVWEWLRDNPDVEYKGELPLKLFDKVKDFINDCPLCELFNSNEFDDSEWASHNCAGCPLKTAGQQCDDDEENYWSSWNTETYGKTAKRIRRDAAEDIVKIVKAWKIEGEKK